MSRFQTVDLTDVVRGERQTLTVTLPELLDLYVRANPRKRENLRTYRLKKWRDTFAGLSAWDIDVDHIDAMLAQFDALGYAGSTINREIADIGGCYSWAIRKRYTPEGFLNPTREFVQRDTQPRVVELSDGDVSALLAAAKLADWPKLYALVLLAVHTGGRKSELLNLRWSDIDVENRRADLHETKNGRPRRLLLTPACIDALQAIQPEIEREGMLVFCGRNVFRPHQFRKAWERCRNDAGLPDLHFHDLRHAACARLLKAGVGIHVVATIMGHSDTRMVSRTYGHLDDQHLLSAVDSTWT